MLRRFWYFEFAGWLSLGGCLGEDSRRRGEVSGVRSGINVLRLPSGPALGAINGLRVMLVACRYLRNDGYQCSRTWTLYGIWDGDVGDLSVEQGMWDGMVMLLGLTDYLGCRESQ